MVFPVKKGVLRRVLRRGCPEGAWNAPSETILFFVCFVELFSVIITGHFTASNFWAN